jgi:hypothetical protein
MLLLFVPLYALGGGASLLLILQAVAVALGAVPAYRLGRHAANSTTAGVAVAACYLLSPLGQWAVLADFHTSTLAAPLLLLAVERLIVGRAPFQALAAAALALSAREDVGPTLALLGLILVLANRQAPMLRSTGMAFVIMGALWTLVCLLVLRLYGGSDSAFAGRYAESIGSGLPGVLQALTRPNTLSYAGVLVLSGGWLGLVAPIALLPALPSLAINGLSSSAWMASGQAHYSGLVLPFLVLAAADGLRRVGPRRREASVALVLAAVLAYAWQGAGPFGGRYAPAAITDHAGRAIQMASALPADAAVSASSTLVPHLSGRARVFVFPALQDADHVLLDLRASPAPTSAGDVFLRVQSLLGEGGWRVEAAEDGLLLLARDPLAPPIGSPAMLADSTSEAPLIGDYLDGRLQLLSARLVPSPDATLEADGPRWILRTTWRAVEPLPPGTRLEFWIELDNGRRQHVWDIAHLWWHPPERWTPGEPVTVDVRDVPLRRFASWQPEIRT